MKITMLAIVALVLSPNFAVAQSQPPLLVSIDPSAIPTVQVNPLQRPGAREVNGVVFDPLVASSVTRLAEVQAAQTADFVAQQRAAMQQERIQANALVEWAAQQQAREEEQRRKEYERCVKERESLFGRSRDLLLAVSGTRPPECKF